MAILVKQIVSAILGLGTICDGFSYGSEFMLYWVYISFDVPNAMSTFYQLKWNYNSRKFTNYNKLCYNEGQTVSRNRDIIRSSEIVHLLELVSFPEM